MEKRKTEWILHNVSKQVSGMRWSVLMEHLTHIRKSINGNHTKGLRRRLNRWSFRKLQFFIEYKTVWAGRTVEYSDPAYSSQTCPKCGVRTNPNGQAFTCKKCGFREDRHVVACLNLLKMKGYGWFTPDSLSMTSGNNEEERKQENQNLFPKDSLRMPQRVETPFAP